jgi:LEA14-like dessication related protein
MARTNKTGIDYFPLDVDFFQDEKIQFVSARFGLKGEIIAIRLLCKIYRNGYYTEWDNDTALLFAKSVGDGCQDSFVKDVVHELLKRGFFERSIFERFSILTSKGIQNRYFEAIKRYKQVEVVGDFLLVDVSKMNNVNINSINANINPINVDINSQKKREEKEIKFKKESKKENDLIFHFNSEKFMLAWKQLIEMPKWKKKVNQSLQIALNSLGKYDEEFAIDLIEKAIEGNWQGVTFSNTPDDYEKWKRRKGINVNINSINANINPISANTNFKNANNLTNDERWGNK